MFVSSRIKSVGLLVRVATVASIVNYFLIILSQAAPIAQTISSKEASLTTAANHKSPVVAVISKQHQVSLPGHHQPAQGGSAREAEVPVPAGQKVKRHSKAPAATPTKETSSELDTQETGYLPSAYPAATESDYGYDSGKNTYGKQASDWSLYDQGNHGLYDKYGDKAWKDQGHNDQSSHGKHDSYGNSYNSHGSGHGSGYYSRDRGYGYEKHYAYDKEVASKHHADSHNNYGSQHGLHDNYGNSASNAHLHQGHDKYGQSSRYGNHGYGKRGSNLAANHDYGHNQNKGHYYAHSAPQSTYSSYGSQVPTYRSTYSDYGPTIGYPSSYPSYY